MSIAEEIFSEQDWSKFHKDLLIKGLSDDKIESYCDYMLTAFDDGFDGHLREFQFEDDFRDNFSRITSSNLESDYRTVVYFLFFQYHTKGTVSLDILAIDDRQAQKWLQELLIGVNDSGDWGKYEQIYQSMQAFEWSEGIASLVSKLAETFRQRTLELVGKAYSSVKVEDAATLLGLSTRDAVERGKEAGWRTEDGFLYPSPITVAPPEERTGLDQLQQLTDYIVSLEA